MPVDQFLETRRAFSSQALAEFLEETGAADRGIRKDAVIRRWKRSGWVQSVRNGAYIVTLGEMTPEKGQVTREQVLLAACEPRPDCVLGYHAALAYHLDLPLPSRIRVISKAHLHWSIGERVDQATALENRGRMPRKDKLKLALFEFLPVRISTSSKHPDRSQWGVIQPNPDSAFRVTNLERSLVDVFDRPDHFTSFTEFRDLLAELEHEDVADKLSNMDLMALAAYLEMVDCATTSAKVGYFLDGYWDRFKLTAAKMKSIKRPKFEAIWDRGAEYGRCSSRWNLVLPKELVDVEATPSGPAAPQRNTTPFTGDLKASVKEIFGFDRFNPGQEELIRASLEGRDTFGIFPTGAGKSLVYQLPAKLMDGVTIVISPLLSLMMDQVEEAKARKIRSRTINSTTSTHQRDRTFEKIVAGELDLLFLAPESLAGLIRVLRGLHKYIRMIVIDEAHCIHDWGKTFRPKYRELEVLAKNFNVPKMALTATANKDVQDDILTVMQMRDACLRKLSSFRRNLYIVPKFIGRNYRFSAILDFIRQRSASIKPSDAKPPGGIIYCRSRPDTDEIANRLKAMGIQARAYHAKIPKNDKYIIQNGFKNDEIQVVVATTAFGMGINKKNVQWVIHLHPPSSLSDYIQQIGRAGRNGKGAICILMYVDTELNEMTKSINRMDDSEARTLQLKQIKELKAFIHSKYCRHKIISEFFGDDMDPCGDDARGSCDICTPRLAPRLVFIKDEAPPRKKLKRRTRHASRKVTQPKGQPG